MRSDVVDIEVEIITETDGAILVHTGDPQDKAWLPRSQIEIHNEGRVTVVTCPEGLALEKGLI